MLRGADVNFARFVAGIMMHVAMTSEIKQGIAKMKFVVNHIWRFEYPTVAFATGLGQTLMVVLVTLLNYIVITARAQTVIDVVIDFLALVVISNFDNFFYAEHSSTSEISKKIVEMKDAEYESMFKIQMSTSRDAQPYPQKSVEDFVLEPWNLKDADARKAAAEEYNREAAEYNRFIPLKSTAWITSVQKWANEHDLHNDSKEWKELVRPILMQAGTRHEPPEYIGVKPRCCTLQYFLQKVYQLLRLFYVAFWYYFSPFFFTSFQFVLPLIVLYRDGKLPDVIVEER